MTERIDMGVRVAGEKSQLPDEFITKSQLVTPDGNALETLANGDLVVPAATSDHLVLVDELDANPGTLLDKIYPADSNVTINVVEIEGKRVMEIGVIDSGGLPTGTGGEMLVNESGTWLAKGMIGIDESVANKTEYTFTVDSLTTAWAKIKFLVQKGTTWLNNFYMTEQSATSPSFRVELGNVVNRLQLDGSDGTGTKSVQLHSKGSSNMINLVRNAAAVFSVDVEGKIKSNYIAGTGNRPLYADSSGNIISQSNGVTMLKRKIVITPNQIRALHTTPVELIPAPGANKIIVPTSVMWHYKFVNEAYTSVDYSPTIDCHFGLGTGLSLFYSTVKIKDCTQDMMYSGTPNYEEIRYYDTGYTLVNSNIVVQNDNGALTNDNAQGYLTVSMSYYIEDLS